MKKELNRGSHKQEAPGLNAVSGSWDMISDEDWHANIWQTDIDREMNIIRYIGEKARDGAKGLSGFCNIDYDTLKLSEPDQGNTSQTEINNFDTAFSLDDSISHSILSILASNK